MIRRLDPTPRARRRAVVLWALWCLTWGLYGAHAMMTARRDTPANWAALVLYLGTLAGVIWATR